MVNHGEDFDAYSEYGCCLTSGYPQFFILAKDIWLTVTVLSVRTDRGTDRTRAGNLHRASERYLVGISRQVHDPNERLPGNTIHRTLSRLVSNRF